jgi:hypothetical protein
MEIQTVRNLTLPTVFMLAPLTLMTGCGRSSEVTNASTVEPKAVIAEIGDLPYGTSPTDDAQFKLEPAFISAINADPDVSLVAHAGDIHSGSQYCTQSYDASIYTHYTAFKDPLVYTPGDNEWADCHKKKEGGGVYNSTTGMVDFLRDANGNLIDYAGGDPLANLSLIRSIFFANPGKTLGVAKTVHTQAQEYDTKYPTDSVYVENVWWEQSKVLMVALNIPGGSNNGTDPWYGAPSASPAQLQAVAERSAATLRWLDTAFKQATANGDIAVVVHVQADMWDIDGASTGAAHLSEYKQYIDRLASNTLSFGKPVLLFNGDSHVYRSDNPLTKGAPCVIEPSSGAAAVACSSTNMPAGSNNPADPYMVQPNGYNVPNFHRVVVHGSSLPLEWLKLTIDPSANAPASATAFGPFSWERIQPKL